MRDDALGFGVYIHWPFCDRICPYCDFNVFRNRSVDEARWVSALIADLTHSRAMTGPRALSSIYFGGGTPSLMSPGAVAQLLEVCTDLWSLRGSCEITLEANPTSAEQARFEGFAAAGVNRLSLGVQSLADEALAFLGRNHSAEDAKAALAAALDAFPNVTFDLIYALPDQNHKMWTEELEEALSYARDHLSLYQLTIEPQTAFQKAAERGALVLPEEDSAAAFYEMTAEMTARAGLEAYEISNHARPGKQSVHNLLYWRCADYVGVGPGAHGRITNDAGRWATLTHKAPAAYLKAAESGGGAFAEKTMLTAEETALEVLAMGLRSVAGVDMARYEALAGAPFDKQTIDGLVHEGLIEVEDGRLTASPAGRVVLNHLTGLLTA